MTTDNYPRDPIVNVRVKPQQLKWIQDEARRMGITRSEMVRLLIHYGHSNSMSFASWANATNPRAMKKKRRKWDNGTRDQ